MITRRGFAQSSAILAGLVTAPVWARQYGGPDKLEYFLIEPESLNQSQIALEPDVLLDQGLRLREIKRADLSEFWFEVLPLVSRQPIGLAGLTSGYSAFVVAQLMQDYGYGFVRAEGVNLMSNTVAPPAEVLRPFEFNTPSTVNWIIAKSGISFR